MDTMFCGEARRRIDGCVAFPRYFTLPCRWQTVDGKSSYLETATDETRSRRDD